MIIGVIGCFGKMGEILCELILKESHTLVKVDPKGREHAYTFENAPTADVWIDFSSAQCCDQVCMLALRDQTPLVLATTGYSSENLKLIQDTSLVLPVFQSANYSLGIYRMRKLLELAMTLSQDEADIELIDVHHKLKKDAPSGTALELSKILSQDHSIPIHSLRMGSVVGDHTALFAYDQEVIEITHRAQSKVIFAQGALKAATYLTQQKPGLYSMDDLFKGEK